MIYKPDDVLVSVIIPVFNRENSIEKSIRSVLNQTYKNIECIVVDDCSTDQSAVRTMGIDDDRIVYIKNDHNVGAAISRNIGVGMAKGEYIAFNDSDDIWRNDKLEKQLKYIMSSDEIGLVYSRYKSIEINLYRIYPDELITLGELQGNIYELLTRLNTIGTPTMLIKKKAWDLIGGFDESLPALEDYDLAIRFSKKYDIGFVDEPLVDCFLSEGGVNSNNINRAIALLKMSQKYEINNLINMAQSILINSSWDEIQYVELINKKEKVKAYFRKCREKISKIKEWINVVCGKKIMIYGMGEIGRLLVEKMDDYDVMIYGYIEKQSIYLNDYKMYKLDNIDADVDYIISTVMPSTLSISDIMSKSGIKAIHLLSIGD